MLKKTVLLLVLFVRIITAQDNDLYFEKITLPFEHGIGTVNCVLQDKQGFIWLGTYDALLRYNGNNFTIFRSDIRDSTSLSGNHILCLYEDGDGFIWIGTMISGLCRYNPVTGKFKQFRADPDNPAKLNSDQIQTICEDSQKNLWIGTSDGLHLYNRKQNRFKRFLHDPKNQQSLSNEVVKAIHEDGEGSLWVGTLNGLNLFDRNSEHFTHFFHNTLNPGSTDSSYITSITEDKKGMLWIGTGKGLYSLKISKRVFIYNKLNSDFSNDMRDIIWTVHADKSGLIWIGTNGAGLYTYNKDTKEIKNYKHNPADLNSINSDNIAYIYEDRAGTIWVGTGNLWGLGEGAGFSGINKTNLRNRQFKYISYIPGEPAAKKPIRPHTIFEDHSGIIWIGTKGDGLIKYNPGKNTYIFFRYNRDDPTSISQNYIMSLYEDRSGNLWVGTFDEGINLFDPEKNTFKRFRHNPNDSTSLSHNRVPSFFEDSFGNFWVVTYGGGLNKMDIRTGKFKTYKYNSDDSTSLSSNYLADIIQDQNKNLWIATWGGGLNRYDYETDSFIRFKHDPGNPRTISSNILWNIHRDKQNRIWLGTNGGLNLFDPLKKIFKCYTEKDGLSHNIVLSILEDDSNRLWLVTGSGLTRFDVERNIFKTYHMKEGLANNGFAFGRPCKTKNGIFYIGSNGLAYFHPDSIRDNQHIPPIFITNFTRFNDNLNDGKPIYDNLISKRKSLELSYEDKVLSFEFTALDYRNPEKNQFAYKLEGFNDSWINLGTKHDVTFTNLDPGEYTLRIKGSNNDGVWNEEGTSLKIYIAPPWWRTNWAYGFYFLAVVSVLLSIRAYELKRQRLKYELEMEHEQAEILKETDHMKSRFFASISHEFRTPLTLIDGPVDRLLQNSRSDQLSDLKRIKDNATHINKLVEMYLDLSKLESGNLKLQQEKQDIIPLLRVVHASFESRAEAEHKKLLFKTDLAAAICNVDKNMFALVMNNLLSNALKFTAAGGEIKVSVASNPTLPTSRDFASLTGPSTEESTSFPFWEEKPVILSEEKNLKIGKSGDSSVAGSFRMTDRANGRNRGIQIQVSDNGIGIPEDQQSKIFDMYFQVENEINKRLIGTGIGLSMVKELVTMHDGTVAVDSTPGQGTTFIINLPLIEAATQKVTGKQPPKTIPDKEQTAEDETEISAAGSKERILIVEDNHKMLDYIKSHLQKEYSIETATHGREGFDKALQTNPQLIISDVMMPEMNGYELCEKLKQDFRTSHIPVILLTAKTEDKDMLAGLETGADAYLKKPFQAQELQIRIRNLIENRLRLHKKFQTEKQLDFKSYNITSADERFLQLCNKVMQNNISNEQFTVDIFAREMAFSRVQLHRKLKALTGLSASGYIRTSRLKKAAALLDADFGSIAEIAYECGFSNHAHFAKLFKEMYKLSPTKYAHKNKSDR